METEKRLTRLAAAKAAKEETVTNEETKIEEVTQVQDTVVQEDVTKVKENDETKLLPDVLSLCPNGQNNNTEKKEEVVSVSSSLDPGPLPQSYFGCSEDQLTHKLLKDKKPKDIISVGERNFEHSVMKKCVLKSDFEQRECAPSVMKSKRVLMKERNLAKGQSAGDKWFHMGAPILTSSLKQDLKLLRMRNALDPAHHYKASDMDKGGPRYFQEGRVIADHTEFYSARIPRKFQKQTLAEELMSDRKQTQYLTLKYQELQEKKSSGQHRLSRIKFKRKFKNKNSKS